jgi:hypothetical protein
MRTPRLANSLQLAVVACCLLLCISATALPASARSSPPSQTFELSTFQPRGTDGVWTADEWLVDFSEADANGTVHAKLRADNWGTVLMESDDPMLLRGDAAARVPGLDSVFFLHHLPNRVEWWWWMPATNHTTIVMQPDFLPLETSCLVYDEKIAQFYAAGATQVGDSNVWTVSLAVINGGDFQQGAILTTFNFTANGIPSGMEPLLLQCGFNDQLGLLSVHVPCCKGDATGTMLTFLMEVQLDWKVTAKLVSQAPWPPTSQQPPDNTLTTEVLGLASTRSPQGGGNSMAFVRKQQLLSPPGGSIATLGWMDPVLGKEDTMFLSYDVGQYSHPRVAFNRLSGDLVVLEYQAPFRYTIVNQQRKRAPRTGVVVFEGDAQPSKRVLLGLYPRDPQ